MSDSDIMINTTFSTDAVQRRTSANEQKRKERNFRKKQYLERKGNFGGKRRNKHKVGQSMPAFPCQTGASAPPQLLPAFTNNRMPHPNCSVGISRASTAPPTSTNSQNSHSTNHLLSKANPSSYLAFDCEMVGTGPKGRINQLARCSLVSYEGDVVYDKFIKPDAPVTDYRTRWSGIRPRDLVNAMPYIQARKEILKLLMGKVVIGHAVHNDFKALGYTHPAVLTRDTARIPLLNTKAGFGEHECISLKRLTKALFNRDIQTGRKGHSSVEDAQATMELYKLVEVEWERELASKSQAS